jgi:ribosomal protein L35AE/L33A
MKNLFLILLAVICVSIGGYAQTYDPSLSTPTNKALGIAQATPTDARTYFYDATNFVYRPYQSTAEVLSYLNLSKYRTGQFDIVVNSGGVLSNGVITGGTNSIWHFKNGTANGDLVLKGIVLSVNGQTGTVVSKSADSLKGQVLDTTVRRHGYVITYDSTNRKYYLAAGTGSGTYTAGTGIDITSNVVSALTTTALWNANQIRGVSVSSTAPALNQILKYDGTSYVPAADNSAIDTSYYSNDTLYLVSGTDTSRVYLSLIPVADNWGTQTWVARAPLYGGGVEGDSAYVDTSRAAGAVATWFLADSIMQVVAAIEVGNFAVLNKTASGADSLSILTGDTAYMKRIKAGTNVTFTVSDSMITINSSGGSAEVNTFAVTMTTDSTYALLQDRIVEYILIKPASALTAFKLGTSIDDDAFIPSTPVIADGTFQMLIAPFHLASNTTLYFDGLTSSTEIKIVFKPLHE